MEEKNNSLIFEERSANFIQLYLKSLTHVTLKASHDFFILEIYVLRKSGILSFPVKNLALSPTYMVRLSSEINFYIY
jgi:hypothetical protein